MRDADHHRVAINDAGGTGDGERFGSRNGGRWAMNLMLINVSTRKFRRAVRLPEGDVPAPAGSGVSKSAASRHFVALSAARMREWMASDLSKLDLLVVQIDGIHMTGELVLVAAIGIDGNGVKHPLGLIEGATENAAVVQALIDDLIARGLDPAVPRLFIIDGSKALSKAIRRSFGREALIQRCQIHKARNIMERLPKPLHAGREAGDDNYDVCDNVSSGHGGPSQTGLLRQVAGRWFEHRPAAHCMDCWGACSGPDQFHRFFFGRKMSGLICSGVMSIMAATVCT